MAPLATVLAALPLVLAVQQAPPQGQPAAPSQELRDRVVATVDGEPILASEVDEVLALGLAETQPGESRGELERRVLRRLIDQRLSYREAGRYGDLEVPAEEIDAQVEMLEQRVGGEEALDRRLAEVGLGRTGLRQLFARQLVLTRFVESRLGRRVFVSLDDIRAHYQEELIPVLEAQGAEVPALEDVREDIRTVLRERRLTEEVETWMEELRLEADVEILLDDYPGELPPVVETLEAPVPSDSSP